jgi:hypothetical protein
MAITRMREQEIATAVPAAAPIRRCRTPYLELDVAAYAEKRK